MSSNTREKLMIELDSLLGSERQALLSGDLEKLPNILDRKEKLFGALSEEANPLSGNLPALQEKMAYNQKLTKSALEGILHVSAKVAELRRARTELATYDQNGNRRDIATDNARKLEKRA